MRRYYLLTTLVLISLTNILQAQPDSLWSKAIGGDLDELLYSISPIPGGGYIAGGFTESNADTVRNYWLVRLNEAGNDTVWTRAFLNDSTEMEGTEGRMSIATSDSGAVIVGTGNPRIIKTDGDGVIQWQLTENELTGGIFGIEETADGGFIASGSSRADGESSANATIARITATGTVTWEKTYGTEHDCYLFRATELSNGDFAAVGVHRTLPESNSSDGWLFMISASGDSSTSYFYGVETVNNNEGLNSIRSTTDGGFILLGTQQLDGQSRTPYLIKTDGAGAEQWSTTLSTTMTGELLDVIETSDGDFLLTGYGDLSLGDGFNTVLISANNADGTTNWSMSLTSPGGSAGAGLYEISAGEYLLAGVTIAEAGVPMDGWIIRLGDATSVGIVDKTQLVPATLALHPAYPNPFNPAATIRYDLPEMAEVSLIIYDLLGREMARLVEGQVEAGYHHVVWNGRTADGREVPTGIYIARLVTASSTRSIKMVLMK